MARGLPRTKTKPPPPPPPRPPVAGEADRHIDPTTPYGQADAARLLGMKPSRLRAEVAAGRLLEQVNGHRREYLGSWLLAWYEAGARRGEAG